MIFSRVKQTDLMIFTTHLSTLLKAGVPIVQALSLISNQTSSSKLKGILEDIAKQMKAGSAFGTAMKKYKDVFSNLFIELVASGEESGTLEKNLSFLADQIKKSVILRQKIQAALMYPVLVFIATIGVGGFLSFFVLPQLVVFFGAFTIELPLSTKILLGIAVISRDYGILIFAGLFLFMFFFSLLYRLSFFKTFIDEILLKLPLYGNFLLSAEMAQFNRNLSILLSAGIPIIKAFDISIKTLSNNKLISDSKKIRDKIQTGMSIKQAFLQTSTSFSPLAINMFTVGEQSGNLSETLIYISNFYEDEVDTLSKRLTTILEPILLLTVGLIVAFVAFAIISPIYDLTGSIRR